MVCDTYDFCRSRSSPGVFSVFKTINDRQSEFRKLNEPILSKLLHVEKKCEAIKQIFIDHKSNSLRRWVQTFVTLFDFFFGLPVTVFKSLLNRQY